MDLYAAHDYESLLNTCFEIEGLLSLMRYREEESPREVYDLLKHKVAHLAAELNVATAPCDAEEALEEEMATVPEADAGDATPDSEEAVAESVEFEEAADADFDDTAADADLEVVETEVATAAAEEEAPVVEVSTEDIPVVVLDDAPVVDDDELPVVIEETHVVEPAAPAAAYEPRRDETPSLHEPASLFDELSANDDTERMDEKIARQKSSGDILSALTRNDLIRFRRELFGNSPIIFTDTIHLLSAMGSYAEAEEYLYGDMRWNPDDEVVKDFMAILRNHFSLK